MCAHKRNFYVRACRLVIVYIKSLIVLNRDHTILELCAHLIVMHIQNVLQIPI